MVIFLLAMVIRNVMTIASEKMTVFRWSENWLFRHRCPIGEHTDKRQKTERPLPDAETAEMYIYTLSEKTLQALKWAGPYPYEPALMAYRETLSHPVIEKTTDEVPVCYIPRRSQAPATRYSGRSREQRKPDGQTSCRQRHHASA